MTAYLLCLMLLVCISFLLFWIGGGTFGFSSVKNLDDFGRWFADKQRRKLFISCLYRASAIALALNVLLKSL